MCSLCQVFGRKIYLKRFDALHPLGIRMIFPVTLSVRKMHCASSKPCIYMSFLFFFGIGWMGSIPRRVRIMNPYHELRDRNNSWSVRVVSLMLIWIYSVGGSLDERNSKKIYVVLYILEYCNLNGGRKIFPSIPFVLRAKNIIKFRSRWPKTFPIFFFTFSSNFINFNWILRCPIKWTLK